MNPRPTAPKAVALAKLRYAPIENSQNLSLWKCLNTMIIVHQFNISQRCNATSSVTGGFLGTSMPRI